MLQVQCQEGVVRAVTELHQRHTSVKRRYTRTGQLLEEASPAAAFVLPRRLGVRHPQARQHNAGHDDHQRQRIDIQAQAIEQTPQANHSQNETDRSP
ncbi:hypothetical protein D9M70_637660 [compost metagenome]